jgi:hypothetical protein
LKKGKHYFRPIAADIPDRQWTNRTVTWLTLGPGWR